LLSALVTVGSWLNPNSQRIVRSTADMREIYYRVHGTPFNARPAPYETGKWSRFADFEPDADHGGTQVGGRLRGLTLASSRIDGSINGDDAVAYLEWTFEVRNAQALPREARL